MDRQSNKVLLYVGSTRLCICIFLEEHEEYISDLCFIAIASNTKPTTVILRYSAIRLRIQYCASEHAVHTRVLLLGHHGSHRCWTSYACVLSRYHYFIRAWPIYIHQCKHIIYTYHSAAMNIIIIIYYQLQDFAYISLLKIFTTFIV